VAPLLVLVLAAVGALAGGAASATPSEPVPILIYHAIAPGHEHPPDFVAQMDWLAHDGYHAVTLQQVFDHWHANAPLPSRPVVISFDDGYRSQYSTALPVLRALGWPGVLNLELANLDRPWGLRPREVKAMIRAGWEIDSHTLTHPDLRTLDSARLRKEVAGSRTEIRRRFHVPANFFCYPRGHHDAAVAAAVEAAGYTGATTTTYGLARPEDAFAMARIGTRGIVGARGLAARLRALGLP